MRRERVAEFTSHSNRSYEEAIHAGLALAGARLEDVKELAVKDMRGAPTLGWTKHYEVDLRIRYLTDD